MFTKLELILVKVRHLHGGLILGESAQLPGLHICEASVEELENKAPLVIEALLAENGEHVKAAPVAWPEPGVLAYTLWPKGAWAANPEVRAVAEAAGVPPLLAEAKEDDAGASS